MWDFAGICYYEMYLSLLRCAIGQSIVSRILDLLSTSPAQYVTWHAHLDEYPLLNETMKSVALTRSIQSCCRSC